MFKSHVKNILFFTLTVLLSGFSFAVAALEDPTKPPGFVRSGNATGTAQAPRWVVSSILISKDRRLAVVNGKTVKRGEKIAGAKVVSISATDVKLRTSVETFIVKLLPAQVKSVRKE